MHRGSFVSAVCLLAAALGTSGGAHAQVRKPVEHPLEKSPKGRHMSCEAQRYAALARGQRSAAAEYFELALMSHNVYDDRKSPQYVLPGGWQPVNRLSVRGHAAAPGLAYDVYTRLGADGKDEVVVAYRGTDDLWDWINNLSRKEPPQYKVSRRNLRQQIRPAFPRARITVTGHSLGGGIALNVALRTEQVEAVVFNTSPRTFSGLQTHRNRLVHLFEDGEILGPGNRVYLPIKLEGHDFTPHKFNYFSGTEWRNNPIKQHGMYAFSRALLLTAVVDGSPDARHAFMKNVREETARTVDWEVCRPIYKQG